MNCKNGEWKHISLFEHDVPFEPKWGKLVFVLHEISDALCGDYKRRMRYVNRRVKLVCQEHREKEGGSDCCNQRAVMMGMASYNTDKYQEDRVIGGDCRGILIQRYYPIQEFGQNWIDRGCCSKSYHKPFSLQKQDVCPE